MAVVKPFRGIRPPREIVEELSCLPYDVMNSAEAAEMASGKPKSLLHVTRAEIDCPPGTDVHSSEVYNKALGNYRDFCNKGWLRQDPAPGYYIYAQTMEERTQYGIVGCAACSDYENGIIKKHELTRPDKEEDRMVLTRHLNANIEPVFFAYKALPELDEIVENIVQNQPPEYDFASEEGFRHAFWPIVNPPVVERIEKLFFEKVPFTYVADGHHRTAAAARIGAEKRSLNPYHTGNEEYNFFMAVHFPDSQLKILDYNRLVSDLNGLSESGFISRISESFIVEEMGSEIYKPSRLHEFSMYLGGKWFRLTARTGTYNDLDPISILDVTILSEQILIPILGITNLRTSEKIDFVGGIRGLGELKRRVDSGNMKAAFALYPVSMDQLINIADSGNIMPPKTTWFEPKLRSGLIIHSLE